MNNPPLSALVLGDAGPAEFQPVLELVHRRLAPDNLRTAADFAACRQTIDHGWFPDVVIALQAWPDQFSVREVEELISLCPLARIICCFGPWCDSDGRTRSIWPLGVRVSAGAFASRFEHELAHLTANRDATGTPLPLTASRTEIFDFDFGRPIAPRSSAAGMSKRGVSILSPDRRFREMLAAELQTAGCHLDESDDARPPVVIFDADPWDDDRTDALAKTRTSHPRSRIIACVGFPRPHLDSELRATGADGIWFKLAPLADLIELVGAQALACAGS